MNNHPHIQQQDGRAGFSLIELIVTLGVIGIIAAISAPAFMGMAPNIALKSAARDLYSNLQGAKVLAIKENKNVTVRFDTPGYYYFDDDADGVWDAGERRILLSEDLNGNGVEDAGEDVNGNGIWEQNYGITRSFSAVTGGKDWNGQGCVQLNAITFSTLGLATLDPVPPAPPSLPAVYLQNKNADTPSYSVEARTAGSLKLRRFYGSSWTD